MADDREMRVSSLTAILDRDDRMRATFHPYGPGVPALVGLGFLILAPSYHATLTFTCLDKAYGERLAAAINSAAEDPPAKLPEREETGDQPGPEEATVAIPPDDGQSLLCGGEGAGQQPSPPLFEIPHLEPSLPPEFRRLRLRPEFADLYDPEGRYRTEPVYEVPPSDVGRRMAEEFERRMGRKGLVVTFDNGQVVAAHMVPADHFEAAQ